MVATDFENMWNFPNCLGALDGRHILFSAPISSGSYYHNYKGTDSIVLLALVDANYNFLYVNVGINGRVSDGGVFNACNLAQKLYNKSLDLPEPRALPGRAKKVPYVIVADDAFPLIENVMKPYPQRGLSQESQIFNYRLSRARRMVECAFGILANRWRVLLQKIHLCPEKVELITLTCVVLHNFLVKECTRYIDDGNFEEPNHVLAQITNQGGNRSNVRAREIRDEFKEYFSSPSGTVPWQLDAVKHGG